MVLICFSLITFTAQEQFRGTSQLVDIAVATVWFDVFVWPEKLTGFHSKCCGCRGMHGKCYTNVWEEKYIQSCQYLWLKSGLTESKSDLSMLSK